MERERPAPVTVIAILHFVFGGLGLLGGLCGIAMQSAFDPKMFQMQGAQQPGMPKAMDPAEIEKKIDARMPIPTKTFNIVEAGTGVVLAVMMIIAGIGLLQLRSWGRTLSLVYAVLSIVNRIGLAIFSVVYVIPATKEFLEEFLQEARRPGMTPQEQQVLNIMSTSMNVGLYVSMIGHLIALAYPIAVLAIMNMQSTKRAFGLLPYLEDLDEPRAEDEPDNRFDR